MWQMLYISICDDTYVGFVYSNLMNFSFFSHLMGLLIKLFRLERTSMLAFQTIIPLLLCDIRSADPCRQCTLCLIGKTSIII